jgi:Fe-S-cluster containining protein
MCCQETEMLLSEADINQLEKTGYDKPRFVRFDKKGYAKLRNLQGHCVFFDVEKQRCKVYHYRPLGCRLYPVIYGEEDGLMVDYLCPEKASVSTIELERKGREVIKLLEIIDGEAEKRKQNFL